MNKSIRYLLLFIVFLTGYVYVMGLLTKSSRALPGSKQDAVEESQFPVADATASEPSSPAERLKKHDKEKKYKRYTDTIGPGVTVASVHYHWPPAFPTLPAAQSDVVIIGHVSDAKAHITSDRETVYSEFTVSIDKILKDDNQNPLSSGKTIVAERPGGRVRYPSGHISRFSVTGWGMPRAGRQYVFFLNRNGEEDEYRIVTGYEVRNGRIFPLDRTTSSATDFDAYIDMDEALFFNQLNAAIVKASPASPQ